MPGSAIYMHIKKHEEFLEFMNNSRLTTLATQKLGWREKGV